MADDAVCAWCGQPVPSSTATWSSSPTGPERTHRLCAPCTRDHLRSIEARLDEHWWEPPAG